MTRGQIREHVDHWYQLHVLAMHEGRGEDAKVALLALEMLNSAYTALIDGLTAAYGSLTPDP